MIDRNALAKLTAEVVASYVGNSSLSEAELDRATQQLPKLINGVHEALLKIIRGEQTATEFSAADNEESPEYEPITAAKVNVASSKDTLQPAVLPEKSVHNDYLVCLESGRRMKTLKRHLITHYGLTPEAYRTKWNLPDDYPMACKSYREIRSKVAKRIGLGIDGRGSSPAYVPGARKRAAIKSE